MSLLRTQYDIALEGIVYANQFTLVENAINTNPKFYDESRKLIERSFAHESSLAWCKIFGSEKEKYHFNKIWEQENEIISYSKDDALNKIFTSKNMKYSSQEKDFYPDYTKMQKEVIRYRNKILSHREENQEIKALSIKYPHIYPIEQTLRAFIGQVLLPNSPDKLDEIDSYINRLSNGTNTILTPNLIRDA